MCCPQRDSLAVMQAAAVADLKKLIESFVAEGNEYYAELVRKELVTAESLARLIHRH